MPEYKKFNLPSRGVPYLDKDGNPLIPDGEIELREMTGLEESILNSPTLPLVEKFNKLITNCVKFPSPQCNARNLISGDRLMLLVLLRGESFGTTYNMEVECPKQECRCKVQRVVDLYRDMDAEEMPRVVKGADGVEKTYEYSVRDGINLDLPKAKVTVNLRILTGVEDELIAREISKGTRSKLIPLYARDDPNFFLRNAMSIRSIDGTMFNAGDPRDLATLCDFICKLPMSDRMLIDDTISNYDVNIKAEFDMVCTGCGNRFETGLAMTPEFFRPTNR